MWHIKTLSLTTQKVQPMLKFIVDKQTEKQTDKAKTTCPQSVYTGGIINIDNILYIIIITIIIHAFSIVVCIKTTTENIFFIDYDKTKYVPFLKIVCIL